MGPEKTVSTLGIADGIDYLSKNFIGNLDEQATTAIDTYKKLKNEEILSSANIDNITEEIQTRISSLQKDFDDLSNRLKQGMFQSQEEIENHRQNLENKLSQGIY